MHHAGGVWPGDSGGPLFVSTPSGYVQVMLVSGSFAKHHQNKPESKSKNTGNIHESKTKGNNNKQKKQLHQTVPDYGPELSAPSSADFLASGGV